MNTKPLDFKTVTIPPGTASAPGTVGTQLGGSLCYIATSSGVFAMQFDAGTPFQTQGGFVFNIAPGRFSTQTFFNTSAVPVTVTFYIGQMGVAYIGTSNFKEAPTFIVGSLGATGDNISVPGNATGLGYLEVPGVYQGHVRKQIIVTVYGGNPRVFLKNTAGQTIMRINNSDTPVAINTSETVRLYSENSSASIVNVGEIYYSL